MRWVSPMHEREVVRCAGETHWLRIFCAALVAFLAAAATSLARADDDLPGRVGRIADFGGQLYLSAQDRPDDWTPIGINYPVSLGDNLWVSNDGRAEIDYGGGQFRLAGETSVNVARLDDRQLALFVAKGRLIIRVRVLDTEDVARIDTPNTQIELNRPGLYRIEVAADGSSTKLAVREGEGVVAVVSGAQQVLPGQTVTIFGMQPLAADVRNGIGADGFDTWSADRDRYYERARAAPYVSRQMVGFADLEQYGSWEQSTVYGSVWYPTSVAPDWAPYADGYWTNVGAWGLTWVDSAPWGYAPSHYGRWVHHHGRWGWCPGAYVARPHWAPALVAWYGGAGWGMTAHGGAPVYAWAPLGWGDAYTPWWRGCSEKCWNRYNKSYGVNPGDRANPRGRYANSDAPGALTAVPGATLVGRKPVVTTRVPVPSAQLASAPILATPPSVTPRSFAGQVFRPGERGTPTPASAVSSTTQRTALLPPTPRTALTVPSTAGSTSAPTAATMPNASAAAQSSARVQPAPLTPVPAPARTTQVPAARASTAAATDATHDPQATRRPAPTSPAGSAVSTRELPVHYGNAVAPPASFATPPSATPYPARGSIGTPTSVPATGLALPSPRVTVPPTGIVVPASGITVPSTGIGLPPSAIAIPPTGVVVPATAPAVGAQGDRGAVRPSVDADAARGARMPIGLAPPTQR